MIPTNVPTVVRQIIADQLGLHLDQVKSEHKIMDDLGGDSLDTVEIAMALEESFSIEFPDEDIEPKLRGSIDELTKYIAGKVRQ